MDRRVLDPRRRRGSPAGRAIRPARRQRSGGPDCPVGPPPFARASPRRDHARDRLRRQASQDLCAHRIRARLLPRRTVVSEDRRLRAGGDARTKSGRLELSRVPRRIRVLRRLRELRRDHDRALAVPRRRDGQARRRDEDRRQDQLSLRAERTSTTSPGRRIHGFSWSTSRSTRPATCRRAGRRSPPKSSR